MLFDRNASDEELVRMCKSGDESAFNELIERYKKMGFSLAYNMTGSVEDAEDIAQDAFVAVYNHIGRFREESSFSTWFYKIVLNLCRRHLRKRKLTSVLSLGLLDREGREIITEPRTDSTPERQLRSRQIGRSVQALLKTLPLRQREVFIMKHMKGMKISEIAEVTGCSEGAVKSHLFRAVKRLQAGLKGV
jgi:RNA polymerase sigma-70 factor (ECF subfamily)